MQGHSGTFCVIAALTLLATASGQLSQISAVSRQQRNEFTLLLAPRTGSTGSDQCNVITGGTPVSGPIRWGVQNGTSLSLNIAADPSAPTGSQLALANASLQTPYLTASVNNGQGSVSYRASGYASPSVTVNFTLSVSGAPSCILTLNLGADLSNSYTFDASMTPNVTISPFAPAGSDPRRNCFTTGARADSTVQGPFVILVPNPGTATFSSSVPLTVYGGATSAPGAVIALTNGTQLQSASYTAAANSIPTQLNLGLGSQCGVTVYFVPLSSSSSG